MSKIHFQYTETNKIHEQMETVCRKGHSRGQVFRDWLLMIVCALSGGRMEETYLQTIKPYIDGEPGKRAVDTLAEMYGILVNAMEDTKKDILGDYFMGAVTFGEHGQFYTPENLTDMMAKIVGDGGGNVCDPCCGSGRMLLSYGRTNPHSTFVGQDLDIRCVHMTAINLALYGLRGYVIHGNSLTHEMHQVFRIGMNGTGVIKEVAVDAVPEKAREKIAEHGEQISLLDAA